MRPLPLLLVLLILTPLGLHGCVEAEEAEVPEADPKTQPVAWMMAHAQRWEDDRTWRRQTLEQMLWRPDLEYASKLLDGYAREDGGWDLLPAYDFLVEPVSTTTDWSTFKGQGLMPKAPPQTEAQWLALGKDVFWKMPMRRDAYVEWAVRQPAVLGEAGLEFGEDGVLPGFVRFATRGGKQRVGMTCGTCHGAQGIGGKANKTIDLGLARARFRQEIGLDEGEFDTWGPGMIDTTDDEVNDPVAIPNLWGLASQQYFNSSGVIHVHSPAVAAARFETQYIVNHNYEVRPPRLLIWALAMYVMSLQAPEPPAGAATDPLVARGKELFGAQCATCHVPADAFSGLLIPASLLMTDPLASQSRLRGTGSYRVPKLQGIGQGGPYMHDHSAATLTEVVATGHPFGQTSLSPEDQQRLGELPPHALTPRILENTAKGSRCQKVPVPLRCFLWHPSSEIPRTSQNVPSDC